MILQYLEPQLSSANIQEISLFQYGESSVQIEMLVPKDRPWFHQNPNITPFASQLVLSSILYFVYTLLLLKKVLKLHCHSIQLPTYQYPQSCTAHTACTRIVFCASLRAGSHVLYYTHDSFHLPLGYYKQIIVYCSMHHWLNKLHVIV